MKRVLFVISVASVLGISALSLADAIKWIDRPFPGFFLSKRVVNTEVGLNHWTGTEGGIRYPDKILKADGQDIHSAQELYRMTGSMRSGTLVTYLVKRGSDLIELGIRTMRFSLFDFLMIYGAYFINGILILLVGSAVFVMKPDAKMSSAALMSSLTASAFAFSSFDVHTSHTWISRIWVASACLNYAPTIHLSMIFPKEKKFIEKRPFVLWLPYVVAIPVASFLSWSYPSDFSAVMYRNITMTGSVLTISAIMATILHAYFFAGSAIARQRARVLIFGGIISYFIPVILNMISMFGGASGKFRVLSNYFMFSNLVWVFCVAYAIIRHNLFDVDIYIRRTVGYGIMTAVVAGAYWGIQVLLESFVIGPLLGGAAVKVYPVFFALLVVFLFNPLNRWVQGGVDRLFYRKKFDYKKTVLSVSDALSSVLDLKEIVRQIVHTVREAMFIDTSGLVLAGAQGETLWGHFIGLAMDDRVKGEEYKEGGGAGEGHDADQEVAIPVDDPLVALVARERRMITKYDVAEDFRFAEERETVGRRFQELGASLAFPLIHKGNVKGILAVGHKKSGYFFTREDVELLQTLATHGAVAIENANLAEQMKKEEVVRANLSRYLSPQIVDRIVKHDVRVNLGGDRKVVTVLFSDIRNFTTITEGRPPDQLVQILNEYFTEMAGVIFANQGSLDKYIGDAVVAVFGSLIPLENPPRNAVAAAVGMMKKVSELNRHWEGRYAFSMNIGIGVATGEVFLGNVGSPERMEFTVIGDAVNVASRFSGLARGGQILVTKPVADSLGDAFRLATLPPAEVKGKTGKMEVFEVLYAQPVS